VIRRVALSAVALVLVVSVPVSAHTPTAGTSRKFAANYQSLPWKYSGTIPTWLQTAYSSSLGSGWNSNNNSRGPVFTYSSTGNGTARYVSSASFDCFDTPGWIGCGQFLGGTSWNIWVRSDPAPGVTYCELNANATGCRMVKRIILHEAMAITSQAGHTHDNQTNSGNLTVMGCQPDSCTKPNAGWNTTTLLECDEAAFQKYYGMALVTGQFANCLDHLTGAVVGQGLETKHVLSTTSGSACGGYSIPISARIAVEVNSSYGLLSDVALATRVIQIDRKLHSTSTWTANWAWLATNTAQTGYNWTRSFTENPAVTTAYDYKLHFLGQSGIASSYSPVFTLTFVHCPP